MAEIFYVNDRVRVVEEWSSFHGMSGTVTQTTPYLMVRFDGDTHPMRIEEPTIAREEPSTLNITGAE